MLKINKHLFRNKILTTTLKKIMDEFEDVYYEQELLNMGDTVSFIFHSEDGKPDNEIMFHILAQVAYKIEDTFEGRLSNDNV
jgi:hypothetical protein